MIIILIFFLHDKYYEMEGVLLIVRQVAILVKIDGSIINWKVISPIYFRWWHEGDKFMLHSIKAVSLLKNRIELNIDIQLL